MNGERTDCTVAALFKGRMIDGSESPNASKGFDSGITYQRNWWYYIIIQGKCSERLRSGQPE